MDCQTMIQMEDGIGVEELIDAVMNVDEILHVFFFVVHSISILLPIIYRNSFNNDRQNTMKSFIKTYSPCNLNS